jgi:uroporphyrinogen-III decarboxylase
MHRGLDGFMSIKQFEKFYWPGLKKAIMTNIELGYIVEPFFEGSWDSCLEYLLELPKGNVVFWTEKTNIFRAKEILGKHMCIQGGVPPSLLSAGSPKKLRTIAKS